ncbi:hypothetical protein DSC_11910 [Pseudoxanthomonas spadix BD-a59]|uniref:DUF2779 domain-containing protein n=1 Tax=Pseudoxanthomonas spadix (strain BD-a59) TaxID=1045855 RepID=G7UQV4_PSEUP|nr:DUF2779 domain-containing protein [Pseudoxanthomonas spadix]AER57026.1 hypothetical protein DSC_11910 [Pseudoxanthomonas spadix BD-a59]
MTPPRHWLSKSRIQSGRQCHKRLWLEIHQRDALQWSGAAQARLDEGTRFGDLARDLLGGGHLIAADHLHADEALAQTNALLGDARTDNPRLFEPAFAHNGVRVRVDAFECDPAGDALIEIKSTTSVKEEHLWDCAIQTWVARGAGRRVARIQLGHVDSSFVYRLPGDYTGLLSLVDITRHVDALQPKIRGIVDTLKRVVQDTQPAIARGEHCTTPYGCPFQSHCSAGEPPGPEYPVTLLPRAGKFAGRLADAGYTDLRDVPDAALLSPTHQRVAEVTRTGKTYVSPELPALLADIPYPRAYLDFESIAFVVPRWLGTRPFQQLPFQFSCHMELQPGVFAHQEFLDVSGNSCLQAFVEALIPAVDGAASIIVYNQAFEATRLRELAEMFPQHADALNAIVARMVDLLPLYRKHYYHRDQRGSWSIKSVLPTVASELDYAQLDVAGGEDAQMAYLRAIDPATDALERERLREGLLAYCHRDTWAMVRLAHAFDD